MAFQAVNTGSIPVHPSIEFHALPPLSDNRDFMVRVAVNGRSYMQRFVVTHKQLAMAAIYTGDIIEIERKKATKKLIEFVEDTQQTFDENGKRLIIWDQSIG